jgi:DNA processing protein
MEKHIIDEQWHKECAYAYFWETVPGIGSKTIERLYTQYGSYERMYRTQKPSGIRDIQRAALEEKKKIWMVKEEYQKLLANKIWCIPRKVLGYPDKLQQLDTPPSALFVKGKLPDACCPAVAVVGARNCSPYGDWTARILGQRLAENGIQVVSGMARGVDVIAQRSAFQNGGATFGVLGNGVDICYPEENRELYRCLAEGENGGGIISEFAPGIQPQANHFPMRNRIISGISDMLVVVEAKEKSGTFITVTSALEQGKDVYVIPGRLQDPLSCGCNRLIAQGAEIIYDINAFVAGILEHSAYVKARSGQLISDTKLPDNQMPAGIGKEEIVVLDMLDMQFIPLESILEKLPEEMGVPGLLTILATLECRGLVEKEGSFYRKKL